MTAAVYAKRLVQGSSDTPLTRGAKALVRTSVTVYDYAAALAARALLGPSPAGGRDAVILVRVDNIGDFVLWLPAAQRLRQYFGSRRIILVVNAAVAGLAASFDFWDDIVPVERDRFRTDFNYRLEVLRRLHGAGSTLINAVPNGDFGVSHALTISLAPRETYGAFDTRSSLKNWLAARHYRRSLQLAAFGPEWEKNQKLADMITGEKPSEAQAHPLRGCGFPPLCPPLRTPYFVVLPGATWEGRKWRPERFAAVARRLQEATGWTGYALGTKVDREDGAVIAAALGGQEHNLCGQTNLNGLITAIQGASLVLTNESGGAHIANALGVPVVCVLGGGHYGRFLPPPPEPDCAAFMLTETMDCYECDWNCRYPRAAGAPVRCIDRQSVDDIWQLVLSALASLGSARQNENLHVAS